MSATKPLAPERSALPRPARSNAKADTVIDRLLARGVDRPDFLRLLADDERETTFSYDDLLRHGADYAEMYAALGCRAGDHVLVLHGHGIELYAAFVGGLLAGLAPTIGTFASPKLASGEWERIVADLVSEARPRLIVTTPALADRLRALASGALGASRVVCEPPGNRNGGEALAQAGARRVDPDSPAFLQYSSGTTGRKKGVMISHRALLAQIDTYARAIDLRDDDVIVSWLPLYHDMGLIACLMAPLLTRTRLVAMCPFAWARRPAMWPRTVTRFRGTLSWLPNFSYSFMSRAISDDDLAGADLSSLRGVVNCSEPILATSHDAFVSRFSRYGLRPNALAASYAMAENTFAVTSGGFGAAPREMTVDARAFQVDGRVESPASGAAIKRLISSGRALPETEIRILTAEGATLPERRVGEIVVRSPCMLTGYFRNEDATRRAVRDGWLHTGDLGFICDDELFVIGRKHDVMCVRGQTLHPQDIEQIVNETAGVIPGRCVAFGVMDESAGTERVVIVAETREPLREAEERLSTMIRRRVADATDITPDDVRIVAPLWLRKSSSGKLSRAANRARYLELLAIHPTPDAKPVAGPVTLPVGAPAPHDPASPALLTTVRECVQHTLAELRAPDQRIANDEPLISSGLIDSLGLAALLNRLETTLGRRVPADLLRDPRTVDTVHALCAALSGDAHNPDAARDLLPEDIAPTLLTFDADHPVPRPRQRLNFWSLYYRAALRLRGVRVGKRLRVLGPLLLRFDGDPRNVSIGDDVTLMPWVDLKNREHGRIILHDRVTLDTGVRLVAANEARIEIGQEAQLGLGTLVNAGADVTIGRRAAIAGRCALIASEHRYESRAPLLSQGYRHDPITIGADAWLASDVFVGRGVRVGTGAVVAVKSVVTGDIPDFAVAAGAPARLIRYRGD